MLEDHKAEQEANHSFKLKIKRPSSILDWFEPRI
jgi:hypothetical protein